MLTDPAVVAARAVRLATDHQVVAVDGTVVEVRARSICIHGDTPGAVQLAQAVEAPALEVRGRPDPSRSPADENGDEPATSPMKVLEVGPLARLVEVDPGRRQDGRPRCAPRGYQGSSTSSRRPGRCWFAAPTVPRWHR